MVHAPSFIWYRRPFFGPSPIQDYMQENKLRRQSLDSIVRLSSILPRYYHLVLLLALLPITTVTPCDVTPSPQYYRDCGPHYRGFPMVSTVFPPSPICADLEYSLSRCWTQQCCIVASNNKKPSCR